MSIFHTVQSLKYQWTKMKSDIILQPIGAMDYNDIQMDKNISHFQQMLDQNQIHFPMLLISGQSDQSDFPYSGLINQQPERVTDIFENDNFFLSSPNPFLIDRKSSEKCQSESLVNYNSENEDFFVKIQHFEEDQCSQSFFIEQKYQEVPYEQSSTESKDDECHQQQLKKRRINRKYKKGHINKKKSQKFNQQQLKKEEFQISDFKRKGTLKNISQLIFQIILKYDDLSYSEVAARLIDYLDKEQIKKGKKISQNQIKNMKRRVYDGLNVFISAGIADRENKKIRIKDKFKNQLKGWRMNCKQKRQIKEKNLIDLRYDFEKSLERLSLKKKILKELKEKKQHLKRFFCSQQLMHPHNRPSSKIPFPFVCVTANSKARCQIHMSQKFDQQNILSNKNSIQTYENDHQADFVIIDLSNQTLLDCIKIEGDIDFIEKVGQLYGKSSIELARLLK